MVIFAISYITYTTVRGGKMTDEIKQVTMTQEALDGLFVERANRAANAREAEILRQAGISSVPELIEAVKKVKTVDTDLAQAQQLANNLETKLAETIAQHNDNLAKFKANFASIVANTQVNAAARTMNFLTEAIEDVAGLVKAQLSNGKLTIDEETWSINGLEEFLKTVATQKPHWTTPASSLNRTPQKNLGGVPTPEPVEVPKGNSTVRL
jgi:HD-GYP domain-containing protein (c-di-GMP phosphodiesterase class II)